MEEIMKTAQVGAGVVGPTARKRIWSVFLWVLQIAAAGMFLSAGYGKLTADPQMVAAFEAIGFGQWFRVLTGSLEVLGSVLLLIPRFSGFGALLLAAVMVGAVLTHLFLVGGSALPAATLLVALAPVALARPGGARMLLHRVTH